MKPFDCFFTYFFSHMKQAKIPLLTTKDRAQRRQRKAEKRAATRQRLENNRWYARLQKMADVLDRYYLDAAIGFVIPGGIGDAITVLFSLVYIVFSACCVRSVWLTLAVINNTLHDVLLGMIPFYVGDIIDVFHRSNLQNMALIRGFVEGDDAVINAVNRKATFSIVLFFSLCVMIYFMIRLVIWAAQYMINLF